MRRFVFSICTVFLLIISMTNCAPSKPTGADKTAKRLTYFIPLYDHIAKTASSMADIPMYQYLEKETGVHIDFIHPTEPLKQFNLLVASGDLPDMAQFSLADYNGGVQKIMDDKIVAPLNELLDNYAPNLKRVFESNPDWARQARLEDGRYFCFPFIREDESLLFWQGWVMRRDWLEKLRLGVPATLADWDDVLHRFQSELGVAHPLNPFTNAESESFMGIFGAGSGFLLVDGRVVFGPGMPEYMDYLKLMRGWYSDGIINPRYMFQNAETMRARAINGEVGALYVTGGGELGSLLEDGAKNNSEFSMVGVPYPMLRKGDTPDYGYRDAEVVLPLCTVITTACKDKPLAAAWLDYGYSEEGHTLFNFGIEGISYKMENGYPKYLDSLLNDPGGLATVFSMSRYISANYGGPFVQDKRYYDQYLKTKEQKEAVSAWLLSTCKRKLPPIQLTAAENVAVTAFNTQNAGRVPNTDIEIICGAKPLEYHDEIISSLREKGLDEIERIFQRAYERYIGNGGGKH